MSHSVVHVLVPKDTVPHNKRIDLYESDDAWFCGYISGALAQFSEHLPVHTGEFHDCICDEDDRAECDECHGEGKYESLRNPKSRWDWYQIGGRWSGRLSEYNQRLIHDPEFKVNCPSCNGTGKGKITNDKHPKFGEECECFWCDGEAKITDNAKIKPYYRTGEKDITRVRDVVNLMETYPNARPFAILTPLGEWIERGEMGWWGCVSNEKNEAEWVESVRKVYEQYMDCYLVAVDVHI